MNARTETGTDATKRGILKKITVASCNAKPKIERLVDHVREHGADTVMPLLRIVGAASDFQPGETAQSGPYVKLLGQFKATNLETGEIYVSGACILPGAASDLIYGALRGLENGGAVQFALNIGVRRDESAPVGYVYAIEQILEPGAVDPLADMERRLGLSAPKQGALAAPAAQTAQEHLDAGEATETAQKPDGDEQGSGKGNGKGKGK